MIVLFLEFYFYSIFIYYVKYILFWIFVYVIEMLFGMK